MLINENLIKIKTKCRPGEKNLKNWIVIHETSNISPDAGAENHSRYLSRLAEDNNIYLSWHYTVDDNKIIRHIPDDEIAWHAGDGRIKNGGNMNGIGIEICVNKNSNFRVAVKNATKLVAYLMKKHKIDISGVKQHNYFNGKNCPAIIRKYNFWNEFLKMCKNEYIFLNRNK